MFRDPSHPIAGRYAVSQEELPDARLAEWGGRYPPYCTGLLQHSHNTHNTF